MRPRKLKFGCGVSFPATQTVASIKNNITTAVENGRFNLGEDCTGSILCTYSSENGEIKRLELNVFGRKISMLGLRAKKCKTISKTDS